MGSNGLTSARHDLLTSVYGEKYPESRDPNVDPKYQYTGSYDLLDEVEVVGKKMKVGELILSPTRTYMPLIQSILADDSIHVTGMIHCTGGGQSKVRSEEHTSELQ